MPTNASKAASIFIAQIGGALRLEGISHSQSRQNFAISQAVEWAGDIAGHLQHVGVNHRRL